MQNYFYPRPSSFRKTPFATGPEDAPQQILKRIDDGRITLSGGAWDTVSDLGKVHDYSCFIFELNC